MTVFPGSIKVTMGLAALGILTYISASALLWHFPLLIHKKKKTTFRATHISHRGGSAEGYENTLNNFKRAVSSGTEMLELDVRLTSDGKVVVIHDKDMRRLFGLQSSIADVNYNQLPKINVTVPIDTIPGTHFSDPSLNEQERRVPLLSDVFDAFPNLPINIDVKDNNSPELIQKVADLIQSYGRQELTVWGSFNHRDCLRLYQADPTVGLFFSGQRVAILLLLAITGLLPFVPLRETHYEVFLPLALKRRRLAEVEVLSLQEKILFWFSDTFLIWRPVINHLRKRGIQVYLWVANSEDEYEECLQRGADGIMTDYPTKLRQFLDQYYTDSTSSNNEGVSVNDSGPTHDDDTVVDPAVTS